MMTKGWRPIETAPKRRSVELGWIVNGWLEYSSVISQFVGDHWQGGWTPTHWRPLAPDATHITGDAKP